MPEKMWGDEPYFGLGYDWDPDWLLTDRQQALRDTLIELCERELRANAKRFDDTLEFPRRNLELLGEHGFLALTVPEEYGGLGEDHVAYAMTCETIARYGCSSTAMCYVMHMGAVNAIMLRPTAIPGRHLHPAVEQRQDRHAVLLGPRDREPLLVPDLLRRGAGGRRLQRAQEGLVDHVRRLRRLLRGADHQPRLLRIRRPLGVRGRCRRRSRQARAVGRVGLRGNQSGTLDVQGFVPGDQIIGPVGDGAASNDESVDPWFLLGSSSVWNGISLGAIDIAKRQTTRKKHVDVGLRVCDYPTIQDCVGEALIDTNASRLFAYSIAKAFDDATDHNTRQLAPGETARADFLHWAWQIKFVAAKNVAKVCDDMLHACGGTGYKRDMELERYLRDGKAGWVMGPTNEVLRQFVGKAVLLGFDSLDYWNQSVNQRAIDNEVKKLYAKGKRALAERLLAEADAAETAPAGSKA